MKNNASKEADRLYILLVVSGVLATLTYSLLI